MHEGRFSNTGFKIIHYTMADLIINQFSRSKPVLVWYIGFWRVSIQAWTLICRTRINWYYFMKPQDIPKFIVCLYPTLSLHLSIPRAFFSSDTPINISCMKNICASKHLYVKFSNAFSKLIRWFNELDD